MNNFKKCLILTSALAGIFLSSGCNQSGNWDDQYASRNTAVCVDPRTKQRVPDDQCQRYNNSGSWYYLGQNSRVPYYNEPVNGGQWTRTAGATYYHAPVNTSMTRSSYDSSPVGRASYASAVSRGGLGATGEGHVGGMGE